MWQNQRHKPAIGLLLLLMVVLGFVAGYRILPQTGLARLLNYVGWLDASLPFASAMEPPEEVPVEPKTTESGLPAKAEPRLVFMEETAIQAYAALAEQTAQAAQNTPLIAIYCTHSSEEYSGEARVPGARGGVHMVAQELCKSLNSLGLPSIYCDTVHDYPDWDLSYANSLESMQKLQEQYPSLEMFIDVHRDSQANSVLETGTGNIARIMLVVGSNARLEHPGWQQNRAFAQSIGQALEELVPGITRGVNAQNGRYNQHLSQKAILVEMGSTVNTTAEACASAAWLAKAIAEVLK